jgi:hypothetical protein
MKPPPAPVFLVARLSCSHIGKTLKLFLHHFQNISDHMFDHSPADIRLDRLVRHVP